MTTLVPSAVEDKTGEFKQGMKKEQQNIRGETDASCVMNEKDKSYVMEHRKGLSNALRLQWPRSTQ
ncbi:hypothetical protein JG687_00004955 [Phytophthora cactorum]|uniref:Uncharacterized protein n=1 Tax=Phytophthora cactorum TaxID=29920 RepID=A0A8T1URV4_9STRA|nr:hypothetical protein JG687_00004955 [Phytophthora cactorum]